MGSVEYLYNLKTKKGSGRYRAIAWNARTQRKERLGTFETKEDAELAIAKREQEMDDRAADFGVPVERNRRRVTFAEYAAAWIAEPDPEWEPNTCKNKRDDIRSLNKTFGELLIDEIEVRHVGDWARGPGLFREDGGGKLAPITRKARLTGFRQIMEQAIIDGLRTDDPSARLSKIKVPKRGSSNAVFLDEQDFFLVLAFLPNWFWPAAILALDSGLRAAEVAGLRWRRLELDDPMRAKVLVADVMEQDGTPRDHPKGKDWVWVPVSPRTVAALRALRTMYPAENTDYVFRVRKGGPALLRPQYIRELWQKARFKAGLEKPGEPAVKFHHLRHACATNLALEGYSAPKIMRIMRHKSLTTSQGYIDEVSIDEAQAAVIAVSENGGVKSRRGLRLVSGD